jgi:hypothetical protein
VRFFALKFIHVILILAAGLVCERSFAQVKKDTTIVLINNVALQIEISDALNDLYNFKFAKADLSKSTNGIRCLIFCWD